eukprot:847771-Rhodomonas_salina.2
MLTWFAVRFPSADSSSGVASSSGMRRALSSASDRCPKPETDMREPANAAGVSDKPRNKDPCQQTCLRYAVS